MKVMHEQVDDVEMAINRPFPSGGPLLGRKLRAEFGRKIAIVELKESAQNPTLFQATPMSPATNADSLVENDPGCAYLLASLNETVKPTVLLPDRIKGSGIVAANLPEKCWDPGAGECSQGAIAPLVHDQAPIPALIQRWTPRRSARLARDQKFSELTIA